MAKITAPKLKNDPKNCYTTKVVLTDGGMVQIRAYDFPIYRKEAKEAEDLTALNQATAEQDEASAPRTSGRQCANSEELKQISASSLSRTRNNLIEYTSQNRYEWKSFVTLTFEENLCDVAEANRQLHQFISQTARDCKKDGMQFKYIGVPEFQDRGAVHYHLITNLPCNSKYIPKREPIRTYNKKKHKWYTIEYHHIPHWNGGFSSAFDLDMTDENFNVALYITKYLYKDIDHRLFGHTKFMHSHNLTKPNKFYLMDDQVYLSAMAYLEERGYEIKGHRHEAKGDYDRSMNIYTAHMLTPDDVDEVRAILSENDPESLLIRFSCEPKTEESEEPLTLSGDENMSECQERGKVNGTSTTQRHQILESVQCGECEQVHAEGEGLQGLRPQHGIQSVCEQQQRIHHRRGNKLEN